MALIDGTGDGTFNPVLPLHVAGAATAVAADRIWPAGSSRVSPRSSTGG